MSSQWLCHRCQQRLKIRAVNILFPKKRTFVSFQDLAQPAPQDNPTLENEQINKAEPERAQKSTEKSKQRQAHKTPEDFLEGLYASTRRKQLPSPSEARYSKRDLNGKHPNVEGTRTEPHKGSLTLEELLRRHDSIAQTWKEAVTRSDLQDGTMTSDKGAVSPTALKDFLDRIVQRHISTEDPATRPTLIEIIEAYIRQGLMERAWWNDVLWSLLVPVVHTSVLIVKDPGGVSERMRYRLSVSLSELLKVWTLCLSGRVKARDLAQASTATTQAVRPKDTTSDPPIVKLSTIFAEQFPDTQATITQAIPAAALLTHVTIQIVERQPRYRLSIENGYQWFTRNVGALISGNQPGLDEYRAYILQGGIPKGLYDDLNAMYSDFKRDKPTTERFKPPQPPRASDRDPTAITAQLREASKWGDIKFATKLWERYLGYTSEGMSVDHDAPILYAEFLSCFAVLGCHENVVKIWRTMIKQGIKPTLGHWSAILESCRAARDLPSLKIVWQRMMAAEVRPDNQAWTIYISGLQECRDWHGALGAIEDMSKAWKSFQAQGEASSNVKSGGTNLMKDQYTPSMQPVNAAIHGFFRINKPEVAQSVLDWALNQGLKLSTDTFNILLRPAVRNDRPADVRRILDEMVRYDCHPDVITFTTLLDGVIRNPSSGFRHRSFEEQQKAVSQIFDDMDAAGITASAVTYATILDSVVSSPSPNLPAARATLERMAQQGVAATPHVHTILVMHYFASVPPNLIAIEALRKRVQLENLPVDHVFYDRMIEGYARVGKTEKTLTLIREMPTIGKVPGWLALTGALNALAEAGEWDLCTELVEDVSKERGPLKIGVRGWKGQIEFWNLVEHLRERGKVPAAVQE